MFGVIFLSFIGFDLRGKVDDFQSNNSESISKIKSIVFDAIIPKTQDSFGEAKEFADEHDVTIENAKKILNLIKAYGDTVDFEEYGITVPTSIE